MVHDHAKESGMTHPGAVMASAAAGAVGRLGRVSRCVRGCCESDDSRLDVSDADIETDVPIARGGRPM